MLQCLILAGGIGSRMRPHTETVPKAMLPVAGRPFTDWQLAWLADQGVQRLLFSIGHLGSSIEEFVGDGRRWGVEAEFVEDGPRLLGTAGAIRRAATTGLLDDAFFVLYGDSYLQLDLTEVEAAYRASAKAALMTVIRNDDRWDKSNVIFEDNRVVRYDKYATTGREAMKYIDYGLSVLTRSLFEDPAPDDEPADLAPLLGALSANGQLAGFEARERFFEVGSPQGLQDLEAYLAARVMEASVQTRPVLRR